MKYLIFIAGTVFILLFSWHLSVKYRRYHGIARFFAFESVFILLLMNFRVWFIDPFSLLQLLSWVLMTLSLYAVIAGYLLLKRKGNPEINFENTSKIVNSGLYHYIRHPLYLSIFLLGTGIILKDPGKIQIILGFVILASVIITAKVEENEMIAKFGDEYREYMKKTKMFIPFIL